MTTQTAHSATLAALREPLLRLLRAILADPPPPPAPAIARRA